MYVLVTYKDEENQMKNEGARVVTTLYSYILDSQGQLTLYQASKYLKIGTCRASQKLLAYMGKELIFTRNIKIFTCPAA